MSEIKWAMGVKSGCYCIRRFFSVKSEFKYVFILWSLSDEGDRGRLVSTLG